MSKNLKKVCLIVSGLDSGGVESFIKNYFNYLTNDFKLFIITHNIPKKEIKEEFNKLGFKILIVPPKKKNILKNIYLINKYMKKYQFDIVHSNMVKSNFIYLALAKKNKINIRIAHSHNDIPSKSIINCLTIKIIQYLNRRYSTHRIGCSNNALIYGFGKHILKTTHYYILNNAIDSNKFQFNIKSRNKIRNELKINNEKIIIGHIARFTEQKNHKFLIDTFNQLIKHNNNFILMMIGDGEKKDEIIKYVHKLNIYQYVLFIKPTKNIFEYYSAFDIFVLPSLYEGLPVTLIEAQCNGLKIFISDNIKEEVVISKKIKRLKLDNELWVKELLKTKIKYQRKNDIINSNYNILNEYLKLKNIYMGD